MVLTRRKEREEKRKGHGFQRAGRFRNGGQQAPGWWKARGELQRKARASVEGCACFWLLPERKRDRKVKGKRGSHLLEEVHFLTKEIISLLFSLANLQESQISWGS